MIRRIDSYFWLIAFIAATIMFFYLGAVPLLDPDEPVYAETPKEMIAFNDFLSPRIYGEYWYDKPPMYYWLVAGAFKIFGISEFSARFPTAFLGVAGVLALYLFGCELFNKRAALVGALVLATSVEYFYLAKAAVTDITLSFCLILALLSFLTKRYYLMYIFSGLATVTKGPVGLIFPGAIIFLYLCVTKRLHLLKEMKIPSGILLFSITALPWYLYMYNAHGSAFIETFLGFHNITRFTSPEHPELVVWYYYIPVLVLGFFPWTAILLQSAWASLTKSTQNDFSVLVFLNIWAAFIFVFFTISQTKLVSYILPMYPPLALIAGWYIDFIWASRQRSITWPAAFSVLSAVLVIGMFFGVKSLPDLTAGITVLAGIITVMVVCSLIFMWQKQLNRVFWTQVIGMMLFAMVLVGMLFPVAAPYFTSKYIGQEFSAQYDGKSPVYILKFLRPGFAYYTNIYGNELQKNDFVASINTPGRAYYVVQEEEYKLLPESERGKVKVIAASADRIVLLKE